MKRKKTDRAKQLIFLAAVVGLFLYGGNQALLRLNQALRPHVEKIAFSEVRNAATQVIRQAVGELDLDPQQLIHISRDSSGAITEIQYDTGQLNALMSESLAAAQASLNAAEQGEEDPHTRMVYYDKGIIYSMPLGMLTGSALLAGVGPEMELRMRAVNSLTGQIEARSSAYGLNSTLLQIDMTLSVEMLVISPLLLDSLQVDVRIPLVVQIIQGQIPSLMTGVISG